MSSDTGCRIVETPREDQTFCNICKKILRSDNFVRHQKAKTHRQKAAAAAARSGSDHDEDSNGQVDSQPQEATPATIENPPTEASLDETTNNHQLSSSRILGTRASTRKTDPDAARKTIKANGGISKPPAKGKTSLKAVTKKPKDASENSAAKPFKEVTIEPELASSQEIPTSTTNTDVSDNELIKTDISSVSKKKTCKLRPRRTPSTNAGRKDTARKGGVSKPARQPPRKIADNYWTEEEDRIILHGYFKQIPERDTAKELEDRSVIAIRRRVRVIAGLDDENMKTRTYENILRVYHPALHP